MGFLFNTMDSRKPESQNLLGALVSDIVLDTSTTTTDTIDYLATDTWRNTATATRSVIIDVAAAAAASEAQ